MFIIAEDPAAVDELWLVGDNFMSTTYRQHFLLRKNKEFNETSFMKNEFDFKPFCNSRYNSVMSNMLVRLQNTFAGALNKNKLLPKYVLVILDDDLITYLKFKGQGVSVLLGDWLTWLVDSFQDLIQMRKDQLPSKSKKDSYPCLYWCAAPTHNNYSQERNELRRKYNQCVETIMKNNNNKNMRLIRFKDKWSVFDNSLVVNDQTTDHGLNVYWEAIDASFRFNAMRHELFLAKRLIASQSNVTVNNDIHKEDSESRSKDEMKNFFSRHKDQYHWNRKDQSHKGNKNRFFFAKAQALVILFYLPI